MKHRRWTMRTAILVTFVASVLAALLLQTFFFQRSLRQQIREESVTENETALGKMQEDIASFIHDFRAEMLTIYNESDLVEALRAAADGDESELKAFYWRTWYLGRKRFTTDDRLLAMYLYDAQGNLVSAYRYNCVTLPRNIYDADYDMNTEVVRAYIQSDSTDLMISGYYNPDEKTDVIRFVLKLHTYDEERLNLGYLVCDIDAAALTTIMEKYVDISHICLWLQPTGDCAVAVTGNSTETLQTLQSGISDIVESAADTAVLEEEYENYYLIQVEQAGLNLVAFALVSQSLLSSTQQALMRTLLIIMILMITASVVLAAVLTRWLTRPMEEMRDSITRIKQGETDLRVQTSGWSEELEVLGTEFNDMLDRIQTMAQEEYKYRLLVERTEYKMLQAQINPHFLYNTLDTMSGIANAQNCPLVSGMCHSLSAVFRYSLNMTDDLSTVQQEMAHVRNYLYVMDVRNGFSIAYDYQIDTDTLNLCLPRICLQPIVENAITHGLRNVRKDNKRLQIRAVRSAGKLIVTIRDNGTGMDAEKMNRALEKNDPKRVESGVSIGILNVNARLKKLFGGLYGLRIESAPGEGTTVILLMPAIEKEDDVETEKRTAIEDVRPDEREAGAPAI